MFTEVQEHLLHTYSVTLTPAHLPRPDLTCYLSFVLTLDTAISFAKSHCGDTTSLLKDNTNYGTNLLNLLPQRFQCLTHLPHNSLNAAIKLMASVAAWNPLSPYGLVPLISTDQGSCSYLQAD